MDKKIAKGKDLEEIDMSEIILAVGEFFMSRWNFKITMSSIYNDQTFHFIRFKQLTSKVAFFTAYLLPMTAS